MEDALGSALLTSLPLSYLSIEGEKTVGTPWWVGARALNYIRSVMDAANFNVDISSRQKITD